MTNEYEKMDKPDTGGRYDFIKMSTKKALYGTFRPYRAFLCQFYFQFAVVTSTVAFPVRSTRPIPAGRK